MSKLMDAIEAKFTGKVKPALVNNLLIDYTTKISAPMQMDNMREYKIGVTYYMTGFCQSQELEYMLNNFISGFKRDAYDTIVKDLIDLERALYNQDLEEAKSRLRDIWKEVK